MTMQLNKKKVFISYSHKDIELCEKLKKHLIPFEDQGVIEIWHDSYILPGEKWDEAIQTKLKEADIFLFLLSADFMASEYIRKKEEEIAFAKLSNEEAKIIPILLSTCQLKGTPYQKLQSLPRWDRPITSDHWTNEDEAFRAIVKELRKLLKSEIEEIKPGELLDEDSIIFLDRHIQLTEFNQQFDRKKKIQFFFIHGEKSQEPNSLFDRICKDPGLIGGKTAQIGPVTLKKANDKIAAWGYLLRELFGSFNLSLDDFSTSNVQIDDLLSSPGIKRFEAVSILIQIYIKQWKEYIPDLLQEYFIDSFCKDCLKRYDPNFLIFFQLIYDNTLQGAEIYGERSIKIESKLRQINDMIWLPELKLVDRSYIVEWFDNYIRDYELTLQYVKRFFGEKEQYRMSEIHSKLKMFIRSYNNKEL